MPSITIENVSPLIANEACDGNALTFTFACPASGTKIHSTHALTPGVAQQPEIASKVKKAALSSLRGPLSSAIRGAFGTGTVGKLFGSIASKSASTAISESSKGTKTPAFSKEQRDEAAVEAFTAVANQFEWDPERSSWVSSASAAERLTGFQRQVGAAPIDAPYDRAVASRMMVEVAAADGELQQEEREVLKLFLDPGIASVDELLQHPALSAAELAEVSPGPVRQSMLAISWLVALSNDGCDESESARLESFANGLEISTADATAMRELAEEFLIDQMIAKELAKGDAAQARRSIAELAKTIEMSTTRVERAEARYHKRRSLSNAGV